MNVADDSVLKRLAQTLEQRKHSDARSSYVATLYAGGDDAILKKIGEEATEVILAAKADAAGPNATGQLIRETADLWFHTMVMLAHKDIDISAVLAELESRFGRSGLDEKAARITKEG